MGKRNHFGRQFRIRRKSLFDKNILTMFDAEFCKFMMVRMRRRDVNQVNRRIRSKFLVTAIRFFKTVFFCKSSRLFQVAGCHGVAFHAHPLFFQGFNSGSHLCRNVAAPKNRKFQILHAVNINSTRPRPSKKAANPVYRCSRILHK